MGLAKLVHAMTHPDFTTLIAQGLVVDPAWSAQLAARLGITTAAVLVLM